ncbi:MAG: hypothetical protein A2Z72_03105 [Omnitrophica bacterium RBG_13_46_9]|nr:MAG: hypothetical protein A2Z72_03105 [Omnitrophica bacterium RBG_13_46_9]
MATISGDIITKAAAGDMKAFEEIYKKTSAFVYNVVSRIATNREDADEVTQDVFIKVYKNLGRFNFLSSFNTWVYRIAVNTAINYKKAAEKHTSKRDDYDLAIQSVFTKEEARNNIDLESRKERVSALLSVLNPDQRACIVLREIEGLNYREIADTLKVNINTVRTRLKRARQSLLAFAEKG